MAFLARSTTPANGPTGQRSSPTSPDEENHARWVKVLGAVVVDLAGADVTDRIRILAERQRGFMSRGQLLDASIERHALDRLIVSRRLLRVHHGVYAATYRPAVYLGAETAALLAVRKGAALSHQSAAMLWGLRPDKVRPDGLIHVTVPGVAGGDPDGVVVHRSHILTATDFRVHERLPVTSPARVLLDIAPSSTNRELERVVDQALILRLTSLGQIQQLLKRSGRHRGRSRLQAIIAQRTTTTFTRSQAEERFLAVIRQADLPQPLVNARRHGFEIDFLWPQQRLAVEIDGYTYHHTRSAFEHDRRKDAILQAADIKTMRVTWRQLQREPIAVIARVARAFGAAPR